MMRLLLAIAGAVVNPIAFGAPLFVVAGTLDWPRAWVLLALIAVGSLVGTLLVSMELIRNRLTSPIRADQPKADQLLVFALGPVIGAWYLFVPLDVFHLRLIGEPPLWVGVLGLVLCFVAFVVVVLAERANPFAAPAVRLQTERGHRLVDTGAYGVVRHPLYAGTLGFLVGMPLWLQSWAGALAAVAPIAALVVRIGIEERFLRRELAGYEAYVRRVRYRLIPLLW